MKWPTVALGEVCEIVVGRTPPRRESEFWVGGTEPWLSIADMNQGARITETKEKITASAARAGKRIAEGTVLLSFKLSIGKVAVAGIPLFTNEAIAALPIRDPEVLDADYLRHALASRDLTSESNRAAMGSTLNRAMLSAILFPLPPLAEQRRIAAILNRAEELRSARARAVTILDGFAAALFEATFSGRGFPTVSFSEAVANQQIGLDRRSAEQGEGRAYPYVKMDAITQNGSLDLSSLTHVDADMKEASKYRLVDGDLLFNTRNSREHVGKSAIYRGTACLYNNNIMRIRFNGKFRAEYAHRYLWSAAGRRALEARKSGTTSVFAIYAKNLASLPIPMPPVELQDRFVQQIALIDERRQEISHARTELDRLYASLQSRAFRGEL